MIDTVSDISFISKDFATSNHLEYNSMQRTITLANNSSSTVIGKYTGDLNLNGVMYHHTFYIMDNLVAPLIVGMDILGMH